MIYFTSNQINKAGLYTPEVGGNNLKYYMENLVVFSPKS